MDIISEVSDTLGALIADRGTADPTFQRMLKVYQEVSDLLGRRQDFDQVVAGLLTAASTHQTVTGARAAGQAGPWHCAG